MAYSSEIKNFGNFKIGQKLFLKPKYRDCENIKKLYKDVGFFEMNDIHINMSKIIWVEIDLFFHKKYAYNKSKFDYGISFKKYRVINEDNKNEEFLNHYFPLDLFITFEEKINKLMQL